MLRRPVNLLRADRTAHRQRRCRLRDGLPSRGTHPSPGRDGPDRNATILTFTFN